VKYKDPIHSMIAKGELPLEIEDVVMKEMRKLAALVRARILNCLRFHDFICGGSRVLGSGHLGGVPVRGSRSMV
jgi:hypothetical protein